MWKSIPTTNIKPGMILQMRTPESAQSLQTWWVNSKVYNSDFTHHEKRESFIILILSVHQNDEDEELGVCQGTEICCTALSSHHSGIRTFYLDTKYEHFVMSM